MITRNEEYCRFAFISSNALKIIAIITMLIDHIGAAILINMLRSGKNYGIDYEILNYIYYLLRAVGRTAFPIFCFLLVEGFTHTSNIKKYIFNMAIFAFLSELPFDLAFNEKIDFTSQNVFFTLLIGLCAIYLMDRIKKSKDISNIIVKKIGVVLVGIIATFIAIILRTDYDGIGIILIVTLYVFSNNKVVECIAGLIIFMLLTIRGGFENWIMFGVWAAQITGFILACFYNGRRKININKYFFYAFYPIHLVLLYLIWILFLK